MTTKYAFQEYDAQTMARGLGKDINASFKHCKEICRMIRKKDLQKAKTMLEQVLLEEKPVPFKQHNKNVGHRKGKYAAGRYPKKATMAILKLLLSIEKNAQQKGLNTSALQISHISANKAFAPMRYGRKGGVETKRSHVEIVLKEYAKKAVKKTVKTKKQESKKEEIKVESKQEVKKEINIEEKTKPQEPKKEDKIIEEKPKDTKKQDNEQKEVPDKK